jgi:hypothetical protein
MSEHIRKTLQMLQDRFRDEKWVDVSVYRFFRDELSVALGTDLTYSHVAELIFKRPLFFSGPFSWSTSPDKRPILQLLTKEEAISVASEHLIEMPSCIFKFSNDDDLEILIASESADIKFQTVFYYLRDELSEGESLAYWLDAAAQKP